MGKVNEIALALALGLLYGAIFLVFGLLSTATGWASEALRVHSGFFPGWGPTVIGSIIGAVWGIIFGGVSGYVLGILYNYFDDKIKL
jgi:hypothetical protein